jgi:epoxyqueuosine reductase QueG
MAGERDALKSLLEDVYADKKGVVNLDDVKDTDIYRSAAELLPGAESVIVLAMELFPELVKYLTSGRKVGEKAARDLFHRNTDIVNGHLDWEAYKLVKGLHRLGYKGVPLTAGDSPFDARFVEGMLSYKETAVAAGMGVTGWNSMLLTPEFGARERLTCIVTDAPLEGTSSAVEFNPCPECGGACVKICPVKAISQPEKGESCKIDRFRCNTYLVSSGGCAECLRVCPADRLFKDRA